MGHENHTFCVIHFRQEWNSKHEGRAVTRHLESYLRVALRFSFSCEAEHLFRREQSRISCGLEVLS